MGVYGRDSPDEDVEHTLEDGEGQTEELRDGHVESESLVDQETVERVETTDDEGLAEYHEEE